MRGVRRSFLSRYGSAVASTILATLVRLLLNPVLDDRIPYATYFLAVMFTAWYGGFGPALLAIALGGLAAFYFFVPPQDSLLIQDWSDFLGLLVYVVVGVIGALISEAMHREARRADLNALALRANQEWLSTTLDSIGDAVIATDVEGRVMLINGVAQSLTGWGRDEALGQPLGRVFNIVNEKTRAPVESPVTKALKEGAVVGLANHTLLVARDGSEIPIDDSGAPIRDANGNPTGVVLVFRDITGRRQAEETQRFLVEASQLLSSSLDYRATLVSVARLAVPRLADWCSVNIVEEGQIRQLAVVHVDPAKAEWAQELHRRYPPDPNANRGVPNVVRTGESEFYPEISDSLLVTVARDAGQLEILRQTGMKSAMIVPLIARGRTLGAISLVAAESGRLFTRADLSLAEQLASRAAQAVDNARLYREAQAARDEAESANRAKDEFLATVSHELRTPLNSILGWAHMLRKGTFDRETSARALETIERNAKAQAQLVEDILDVSRIVTGKLRLDIRPVELASVIREAIDSVQPAAEAKGIRIQSVLDAGAGPVSGDPDRLQQVVWNLLSNAVKFTSKAGRVQVRLERVDSHVEIIVSDTGAGIKPEFLPHVFDRFRQADGTSTRMYGGLGLGLAIVRHLVEMHGGTVRAHSEGEGRGATFVVNLPVMAVRGGGQNPATAAS